MPAALVPTRFPLDQHPSGSTEHDRAAQAVSREEVRRARRRSPRPWSPTPHPGSPRRCLRWGWQSSPRRRCRSGSPGRGCWWMSRRRTPRRRCRCPRRGSPRPGPCRRWSRPRRSRPGCPAGRCLGPPCPPRSWPMRFPGDEDRVGERGGVRVDEGADARVAVARREVPCTARRASDGVVRGGAHEDAVHVGQRRVPPRGPSPRSCRPRGSRTWLRRGSGCRSARSPRPRCGRRR